MVAVTQVQRLRASQALQKVQRSLVLMDFVIMKVRTFAFRLCWLSRNLHVLGKTASDASAILTWLSLEMKCDSAATRLAYTGCKGNKCHPFNSHRGQLKIPIYIYINK